jgi:hypothetical protein
MRLLPHLFESLDSYVYMISFKKCNIVNIGFNVKKIRIAEFYHLVKVPYSVSEDFIFANSNMLKFYHLKILLHIHSQHK